MNRILFDPDDNENSKNNSKKNIENNNFSNNNNMNNMNNNNFSNNDNINNNNFSNNNSFSNNDLGNDGNFYGNKFYNDNNFNNNNLKYNSNYSNESINSDDDISNYGNNVVNGRKKGGYFFKNKTKKILRLYSIFLIIMGIVLISKSAFAISFATKKSVAVPQVSVNKMGREIEANVVAKEPIKEIKYNWNGEQENSVQGNGNNELSIKTEIPNGNNILNIIVIGKDGNKSYFKKQYIYESSDTGKPEINIDTVDGKLKITATDDTKISYISYKWNDGTETKIDAESNEKEISTEIEVESGENKLTIIAVDAEGNQAERDEKIIGDLKPEVSISVQNNVLNINAKDDEGISKVSVNIDGKTSDSGETPINQKEVNATMNIEKGNHTIQVVVTNVNGLETKKELSASN